MFFKLVNLEYEIWIIQNYFSVTTVVLPKKYLVHPWNSASCGSMQVALRVLPVWVASHNDSQLRKNITPCSVQVGKNEHCFKESPTFQRSMLPSCPWLKGKTSKRAGLCLQNLLPTCCLFVCWLAQTWTQRLYISPKYWFLSKLRSALT
jgi:hypothetical protein